jgi:hypothetical protein
MDKKLTAIEFLLDNIYLLNSLKWKDIITEAKLREKEQLAKAYYRGVRDEWEGIGKDFEDFYTEKYGKAQ